MKVDPITFAVIKSALDSIVDDMAYTVIRIARSEIVKDVMDFSAALCDAEGQMVAQAKTIAQHLGAMPEAMAAVLAEFGDDLHEGDVVIMNDPYHGGMHLPDIFMFMPIFDGGKRRAFAVVICHHTDVGGRVPGSNASRLHRDLPGRPAHPAAQALRARRAQRHARDADQDQRARARPGAGRSVGAVRRRPGRRARSGQAVRSATAPTRSSAYMAELLDYAERMTRAEIATLAARAPTRSPTISTATASPTTPIPIKVAITVREDGTLAGRLHRLLAAGARPRSTPRSASPSRCTYLSVRCVLRQGHAEQRRRLPLHQGDGARGHRAQSGAARRLRGARAHRLSRVRHHARRAGADRAGPGAGGGRGRQQRRLHQRAHGATASRSSSST